MRHQDALDYRTVLIQYLLGKVKVCDWHGVSDAANDLRELEASHPALTQDAQRMP